MGSKKKTSSSSTSTQTTAPASFALPGITGAAQQVTDAINSRGAIPSMTPDVLNAYKTTAGDASGFASMLKSQLGSGTSLPALSSSFASYDPASIQPVIGAATAPVQRQLEQTLSQIGAGASASGAYGSSRAMTQLPALAISDANRNMQEIAAGLAFQDYNNQQQRALQVPQYLSSIAGLDANAADVLGAANQYQYNAPYLGLSTGIPLLSELSRGYGTQTGSSTSKSTESTGGAGAVVSGIAGLAGMAAGIPGIGSGISGLFGGGFSPMSLGSGPLAGNAGILSDFAKGRS